MIAFFRCVAEAVVEKGIRGLAGMVPGGAYALDVAAEALKKYRDRKKSAEIREEIQQLARANFEEARRAAVEAVRESVPASVPVEDRLMLELYLSQVPGTVRASQKRPDDPSGKTLSAAFALNTPDDVVKLLPGRPPRFKPNDPVPGLASWHLVEPLGSGGFGEVWLARHRSMSSLCGAVKFCHGQQARDLKHESGLIDRVMAAGRHPNIVPLTNAHLEGDSPWLMYEYVPGGDLADLIREWQKLPAADRVAKATAELLTLAGAVGHFHKINPPVVHRDLKPSNILFDRVSEKLRITDFGIGAVMARAALAEEASGVTTRGGRLVSSLRGAHTPLYASPQQRNGDEPDPRDDVHALGVITYQMLTGSFNQGAGADFADDLRECGVGEDVISLLARCVAQRPDRRPANAGQVAEALVRTPSPPPPAPEPVRVQPRASLEANLRRWEASGEPLRWVESRNGLWDEAQWQALLTSLRESAFWPMEEAAVGAVLEGAKRDHLARRAEREREEREKREAREREEAARRAEAERRASEEREERERADAERKASEEAERRARAEAERRQREEAERRARAESEERERREAAKRAEAERREREEAQRRAERERRDREEAEKRAVAEAERREQEHARAASRVSSGWTSPVADPAREVLVQGNSWLLYTAPFGLVLVAVAVYLGPQGTSPATMIVMIVAGLLLFLGRFLGFYRTSPAAVVGRGQLRIHAADGTHHYDTNGLMVELSGGRGLVATLLMLILGFGTKNLMFRTEVGGRRVEWWFPNVVGAKGKVEAMCDVLRQRY